MKVQVTPSLKKDYYYVEIQQENKWPIKLHLEKSEVRQIIHKLDNNIN